MRVTPKPMYIEFRHVELACRQANRHTPHTP
jgi:hypothetical protein